MVKSDNLPQVMSPEPALVEAEDYESHSEKSVKVLSAAELELTHISCLKQDTPESLTGRRLRE